MRKINLILLLALAVRLISLNQSLWLDEAINVTAARDRGVVDLITNYSLGDFHPPLYHLILHFWIKFFGASEISVRTPSIIFGLVTIFFTYKISQLVLPKKYLEFRIWRIKLTAISSLLLATSGLHIYYSGEARMYSLAAMFATVAFYYLLKLTHSPDLVTKTLKVNPTKDLKLKTYFKLTLAYIVNVSKHKKTLSAKLTTSLIFIAFLTGTLLTDYLPWLLLPVFFFVLPLHTLISLTLTLPWWPFISRQLQIGLGVASNYPGWGRVVGGFSLKNLILIPIKLTIGRVSIDNNFIFALILLPPLLLITTLFIYNIKVLNDRPRFRPSLILSWLIVPVILGTILSFKISLLSFFRFLFILPAFYLSFVFATSKLKPRLAFVALSILIITNIISSSAYLFIPKFHRENWRGFSNWIDQQNTTQALTVFPSLAQSAPYNFYQKTVKATDTIVPEQLPRTVYLVRYVQEIFDPQDSKRQLMENLGYTKTEEKFFNGVLVWVYQKPDKVFALNTILTIFYNRTK